MSKSNSCSSNQTPCHSPSWVDEEVLCCDTATEACQLAPHTVSKTSTIYMPFCCSKTDASKPCRNIVYGGTFNPPCPEDPPHLFCNHNANNDGKFGHSWCCPRISGVSCGVLNTDCFFENPLGAAGTSSAKPSSSAKATSTAVATASEFAGTAVVSATPTYISEPQKGSSGNGTTKVAKAAAATSVTVVSLLLIVFGVWFYRRKKMGATLKKGEL